MCTESALTRVAEAEPREFAHFAEARAAAVAEALRERVQIDLQLCDLPIPNIYGYRKLYSYTPVTPLRTESTVHTELDYVVID